MGSGGPIRSFKPPAPPGRRDANVALSQRRAEAVVRFLVERGDVAAGRFEARGFGPDRPLVERALSRADHARNRRVEVCTRWFAVDSAASAACAPRATERPTASRGLTTFHAAATAAVAALGVDTDRDVRADR
ncbi:MAG: OmpA family protein [Myxococcales bacterium]|nr:OmpA family protein [Myxococcales bacterium]